jgi:hypothetical protein
VEGLQQWKPDPSQRVGFLLRGYTLSKSQLTLAMRRTHLDDLPDYQVVEQPTDGRAVKLTLALEYVCVICSI